MRAKSPYVFAAFVLLLTCAPAFAADAQPIVPQTNCSTKLITALAWLQLSACPQAFCNDDGDCQSLCPDDPGAFCNLSTGTCTYSTGSGPGAGGCQSGSLCTPARFCNDNSDCASCFEGCSGYCAPDGICRLI